MEDISKKIVFNKANLPTLSVCLIVKNEEENLKRLLPTLSGVIDEIVIVDTGSTDGTKDVAKFYTNKLYDFEWINDFSAARNESLKYATKDYIMWLDADDMIERQDVIKLKMHLVNHPNTGVYLRLLDKQPRANLDSLQLRVIPNHKGVQFQYKVHEQLSFSLDEKGISTSYGPLTVHHLGYKNDQIMMEKMKRNIAILEDEVKLFPDDFLINLELGKSYVGIDKTAEAEFYIDKAIALLETNDIKISNENYFYTYISKVTILGLNGLVDESIDLLETKRGKLNKLQIYRLTLGELYFRKGDYIKAYKDLLVLKEPIISTTLSLPIDQLITNLMMFFLVASVYVKDKNSVEYCIGKLGNMPNFELPLDW